VHKEGVVIYRLRSRGVKRKMMMMMFKGNSVKLKTTINFSKCCLNYLQETYESVAAYERFTAKVVPYAETVSASVRRGTCRRQRNLSVPNTEVIGNVLHSCYTV